MIGFRDHYLSDFIDAQLRIYDLGSQDVNGSYREIFDSPSWEYIGIDMEAGDNVDVRLMTPYRWREIASKSADVVVSGQAFEHIQYFWITMLEVARVLKPGGVCCLIAPSSGPEHRYPLDCWRFYTDGMASLAHYSQMEILDVSTQWEDLGYADGSDIWHDSILVAKRPITSRWLGIKMSLKRWMQHRVLTIGMR